MKLNWTGTDSLMLVDYSMRTFRKKVYWWIFRRLIRVMEYFIEGHLCDSELVFRNVVRFGTRKPIWTLLPKLTYTEKFPKKEHSTFTVLYYFPRGGDLKFTQWLYGWDIFKAVCRAFPEFRYVVVEGDSDMEYIFPEVDFYLRPNRHDGSSRLRMECEIQEIPYYWSVQNPDLPRIFVMIDECYQQWLQGRK